MVESNVLTDIKWSIMLQRIICLVLVTVIFNNEFSVSTTVSSAGFEPVVIQTKRQELSEGTSSTDEVITCPRWIHLRRLDFVGGLLLIRKTFKTSQDVSVSRNISIVGDEFMLDGKPLQIVSGSLHYFRLPSAYWRDRLMKLKAAGLNAVSTYVEWSYHEPEERQYSFEGDRDIAQFVRIAAEEGLHVLLRPGPYICAERDLGGFPYWLLGKYPKIQLRSQDTDFMRESETWLAKLFKQLTPLLYGNGGPIILVQVENEYGSYNNDKVYMGKLRDILLSHVGNNALLYTTDGAALAYVRGGGVSGALTTIDFGTYTNVRDKFQMLRRFIGRGPLMNSEFYTGWLTHWGEQFPDTAAQAVVATLDDMLTQKGNVNFYMFFGGTNFEFTAGANYDGGYVPDITSYDYDSPLTEAGDPTPKYFAVRDLLKSFNFVDNSTRPPTPSPKGAYGYIKVTPTLNLLSPKGRTTVGKKYSDVKGEKLPTFEEVRQRSGFMLYETNIPEAATGLLAIAAPRDRIQVFIDGVPSGIISRTGKNYYLNVTAQQNSRLSLFVENQGRINFGPLLHDFKGILSPVVFNKKVLDGSWSVLGYPLQNVTDLSIDEQYQETAGPKLYDGYFTIPEGQEPLDTFIKTTGWGKGYIWINGYNLGRYWPGQGPQLTLYVPGVWLRKAPAKNHLQVLELETSPTNLTLESIDHPILGKRTEL